jgi:hypothetical protein
MSPDEAATAAFARSYSETGQFTLPEPLNLPAGGLLGARSMVARGADLVPGGFLGLPWLAGTLHALFGEVILGLMGPLLAVIGVLAWGDIWRRLVSLRFGALAATALAIHPAWLLYAARPLMPNVPFVSLALVSLWALISKPKSPGFAGLAGLCLALSLAIRLSEAIWLLPLAAGLLWTFRARLSVNSLAALLTGFLLGMGALLGFQAGTYGAAVGTGYTSAPVVIGSLAPAAPALQSSLLGLLFPFGFHEWSIVRHAWHYGLALQWWWSAAAVFGAVILLRQAYLKPWKPEWPLVTLVATLLIAAWLAAVYGSWTFFDNPDPRLVTLGNSYARYFLPAFVGASVMVATGLDWLWARAGRGAAICLLTILTVLSFQLVIFGPDGWLHSLRVLDTGLLKRAGVLSHTPADAIIITDRSDKYLLGYRDHLLVPLRDDSTYQALPDLAQLAPLYYFGLTLPPVDIAHLESRYLAPVGLYLSPITTLDDETLYHIHF